ncbi:MAG: hypothetical protein Q7S61_05770 [bacterium]|nr:hypothetical protein [bacterium]
MNHSPVSKGLFFVSIFLAVGIVTGLFIQSIFDTRTKIVFCDVGQGDGAYIRVQNRYDIVIDAGPNTKILECLGKYMPFYDRTIEMAFLSHPQKDHFYGFIPMLDRYTITTFMLNPISNDSKSFQELKSKLTKNSSLHIVNPYAGATYTLGSSHIEIHWPTRQFIAENSLFSSPRKERNNFYTATSDLNAFSLIFAYQEGKIDVLFTGDTTPETLFALSQKANHRYDILKVPHHGSKNGLNSTFLSLAEPTWSVISVGKNNSYGHPHQEVLDMLKAIKTNILRTDEIGDVVFYIENGKLTREPEY